MQTPTTEVDQEQQQPEQTEEQRVEAEEAEAGFAAGFGRVRGEEPADPKGEAKTDTETPAATPAKDAGAATVTPAAAAATAATATPAEDPLKDLPAVVREKLQSIDALAGRMRNIEGNLGGLNSKLDSALATAKAAATKVAGEQAAPTDSQVQAALADPKAWEKLKEEYPDWAGPMEAELTAIRGQIAGLKPQAVDVKAVAKDVSDSLTPTIQAATRQAREFAQVDIKHEGWEETVRTPEFAGWLQSQPADVKALAASDRGRDAIRLLDSYKVHRETVTKAEQERLKKEKRLAAATTPEGTSVPVSTGIDDEQAFSRGFKKVAGK